MATVNHVVVDSGAFIRNAPVETIGKKLYTIKDVVEEIRDRATRQRLQVLPYDLIFREPSAESIRIVTEFSKKTGDYRSLSAVDLRVMALTYQLEKEFVGLEHIKQEPDKKIEWTSSSRPLEQATDIVGFYLQPKKPVSSHTALEGCSEPPNSEDRSSGPTQIITVDREQPEMHSVHTDNKASPDSDNKDCADTDNKNCADTQSYFQSDSHNKNELYDGEVISTDCIEEEDSDEEQGKDEEEGGDDCDGEGWITPSNIKYVKQKLGNEDLTKADVTVGCLTTDFAIQNVLIQMGLNVVSVDGFLIKRAKHFVLRCFACMKITTNIQKHFCPHCGNKTLMKISMTVNQDGSVRYFMSRRRPLNTRGTKFSLPMPKGGKHAVNPNLVADQPRAHNMMSKKARTKVDVFNPDFVANTSPFAINDVTSRAAQLGITGRNGQNHYWDKRNPNESRRRTGRKK